MKIDGNDTVKWISGTDIETALDADKRQYLVGHLSRPQRVEHIDGDIEVGISVYEEFTAETPHVHPVCMDFTYVLEGQMQVRLLDGSGETHTFSKGDFFMIPPGVPHVTKNAPGSRWLFIKAPGMNDKTLVDIDEETAEWLKQW